MENKIVLLNRIVYLGSPLYHCRGPLYKIGWQAVFTTALTILLIVISTGIGLDDELDWDCMGKILSEL